MRWSINKLNGRKILSFLFVTMKVWMLSTSSQQNLLEDSGTAAQHQRRTHTASSVKWALLQGFIVFVGSFALFVGLHYLINHQFGKDGSSEMCQNEGGLQHSETTMLRLMLQNDSEFDQFERLVKDFNITFLTQNDVIQRFQIFTNNFKQIKEFQSQTTHTLFEANRFALMSDDELNNYIMPKAEYEQAVLALDDLKLMDEETAPLPTRPAFVDWRTRNVVTRVKNQGNCGSCWAFAVTATVESTRAIRGHPLEERSEQELVDCNRDNHGCQGGNLPNAFNYIKDRGQTLEKSYSYVAHQQGCRGISAQKAKISGWKVFPLNENYLADWVAANGPVEIIIAVTPDFFAYKGGVFNPRPEDCRSKVKGYHALAVVGYGSQNGDDYWLLKNSWDKTFGESGYIKFKRGVNSCLIGQYAVAPIP